MDFTLDGTSADEFIIYEDSTGCHTYARSRACESLDGSFKPPLLSVPTDTQASTLKHVLEARDHLIQEGLKPVVTSSLLLVMTRRQKRMLRRFGNIVGIDATYKTNQWGLPLYLLTVINAQGQGYPAAFFMSATESKAAVAEVLSQVKLLVPEWDPKVFITDKDDAEIGAIGMLFPNATIVLCDFHVKQAWDRWIKTSAHGVNKKDQDKLYHFLERISKAKNMSLLQARITEFENDTIYTSNSNLQAWWSTEWKSSIHMWAMAYRTNVFTRSIKTNNHTEALNRVIKRLLALRLDLRVDSLLQFLLQTVLPYFDAKHRVAQIKDSVPLARRKASAKYPEAIKPFLEGRPLKVIREVCDRYETAALIPLSAIHPQLERGCYTMIKSIETQQCEYVMYNDCVSIFGEDTTKSFTEWQAEQTANGTLVWHVDVFQGTCSCPDRCQSGQICKHLWRALQESGSCFTSFPARLTETPWLVVDTEMIRKYDGKRAFEPTPFSEPSPSSPFSSPCSLEPSGEPSGTSSQAADIRAKRSQVRILMKTLNTMTYNVQAKDVDVLLGALQQCHDTMQSTIGVSTDFGQRVLKRPRRRQPGADMHVTSHKNEEGTCNFQNRREKGRPKSNKSTNITLSRSERRFTGKRNHPSFKANQNRKQKLRKTSQEESLLPSKD
ncbi:hypothetical protein CYMTET_39782 [Cymbomonas tetramitiformis]|uniref:SWIM-type domain-containing protein n=1 Tax=Cymbomonas tetramitiformis TaxID=36881 RepID=A0AAE0CAG9_9CHLO|nr:hypothetical protein CYMTET_39782 [Cymbomonas tetramitiformis]